MKKAARTLRFLLLQVRDPDDPIRHHEVECFGRVLPTPIDRITVFDLLGGSVDQALLDGTDMILLGGSGDYSASGEGAWLERALDSLRAVHASGKPTFASCWGFQALARAMGGRVEHIPELSEVGTHSLFLTNEGRRDPIFGPLGQEFLAQMGHEEHVVELPPRTTLLASSKRIPYQAYRFDDAPIYCTQFHPELRAVDLNRRLSRYTRYLDLLDDPAGGILDAIVETPETEGIISRFVEKTYGVGATTSRPRA